MARLIKLHDDTYLRLTALLWPKESYNDAVDRLIRIYNALKTEDAFRRRTSKKMPNVPPG